MPAIPTVYVVDDDAGVRESLRWLMESAGLAVETYADGRAFLARFDPDRPACLVLDIRMPGLSGLEVQRELLARGARPPVIIITGHADEHAAAEALRHGALDFMYKPISDRRLLDRVQEALAQVARTSAG